jgi:hypothetical protein
VPDFDGTASGMKRSTMLGAEQRGQEAHELECIGEIGITVRLPLVEQTLEIEGARSREVDDPARGPLVRRPRLRPPVGLVVEVEIAAVQLEAREPTLEQLCMRLSAALIRRPRCDSPTVQV